MNSNLLLKFLLKFLIAFCVGLFVITYVLRIPFIIAGKSDIVNEYYVKNYKTNIPLDALFTLCYLLFFAFIGNALKVKNNIQKILLLAAVTSLITGSFCYYYINNPRKNDIFSTWFNTVGYKSIIYDVILVVTIYSLMLYLDDYIV
jgi:hypothetical protein